MISLEEIKNDACRNDIIEIMTTLHVFYVSPTLLFAETSTAE